MTNLYISYVFSGVTAEQITDVIQNYELLGNVDHVDLVPAKNQSTGKAHNMAFVHMKSWFDNVHAQKTLLAVRNGEKHNIYYESYKKKKTGRNEPFWTVIQNTKVEKKAKTERYSPSMPSLASISEVPYLNLEDDYPLNPPRLVRQNAVRLSRNVSASSTDYGENMLSFAFEAMQMDREIETETETETESLVHESYVKKVENENAKLHARLRSVLWESERRFAGSSDINLSFDQLVQKYGPLTWDADNFDYTDANGFVRRIAHDRANVELCNHMDTWRYGYLTESNMNENDRKLHASYLHLKM